MIMDKITEKNKSNSTFNKARNDEMLFVLRAQDISAPLAVIKWIEINFLNCNDEKLREAFECALEMKKHSNRKQPD